MQITTNSTVSYNVSNIDISNIIIDKLSNDSLIFIIPYSWKNSENLIINRSIKRYTETEILSITNNLSIDFSGPMAIIKNILSDEKVSLRINLYKSENISAMLLSKINNVYSHILLDTANLNTALAPLTIENILNIVEILGVELTK